MKAVPVQKPDIVEINGDTPTLRLFSLLEAIAAKDQLFSLPSLVEETALPKPTLHRMLECCHEAQFAAHGLPSPREAYREAATAARDSHRWSHAAVWHAARATGLQLLASGRLVAGVPNEAQMGIIASFGASDGVSS
jgi:hypothetical protein